MAARDKRLEKMKANPKGDPTQPEILTIPANRPIKPVYIRRLVEFVGRVSEGMENGD